MPLMDEFKEERQAIRQKGLKEKLSYFFDYYKWHTLAIIVAAAAAITLTVHLVNRKDCALYVCLLNAAETSGTKQYKQQFEEYAGIDRSDYEAVFDTSMFIELGGKDRLTGVSYQKMTVYIAAGDLDILVSSPEIIESYAQREIFFDLREILSPRQAALYEPYFFYADRTVMDAMREATENGLTYEAALPDPRHPEAMEEPVPVGIFLDGCPRLKENIMFGDETQVLSVISNSAHIETALKFIDYLLQEP